MFSEGKSTYKNTANQVLLLLLLCHTQSNPSLPPLNYGFFSSVWAALDYINVKRPEEKDLQLEIRAHRLPVYNICKCLLFLSVKASPGCIIGHLMEDAAIRGRIFAPFPSSIPPPATSHKSKKRLCDQISIWSPAATKLTWDHDDFFLLSKS